MAVDEATTGAVRGLLDRYCLGLDRRDFDSLALVFADDASADYDGTTVGPGREALVTYLRALEGLTDTLHHLGPFVVDRDEGGNLVATANALVVVVTDPPSSDSSARLRALRYVFELTGDAERGDLTIGRIVHRCLWMSALPAAPDFVRRSEFDPRL